MSFSTSAIAPTQSSFCVGRKRFQQHPRTLKLRVKCSNEKTDKETPNPGLGLKSVWYGAETFGNLMSTFKGTTTEEPSTSKNADDASTQMTRQEVIDSIRADYDKDYFISGLGEMEAYADDCLFADPFVGFTGVDRFKKNVSNLGALIDEVKLEIYDWEEGEDQVKTKWRFSCLLDLPWRPRLAAAGSTTHVFDKGTNKVIKHIEEWDVDPWRVIKRLLKPSASVPRNQAEVFFYALSAGDLKGMWFATSKPVVIGSLPIVGVSLVTKIVTGEGLQGVFLGTIEGFAYLGLVAGVVTEILKFAQGMQGGETGTGGRF